MSSDDVDSPRYWEQRLIACRGDLQRAMFIGPQEEFDRITKYQRCELIDNILPKESILDCACGYGRFLDLVSGYWNGGYLGIDISPDFIRAARSRHPEREFVVADIRSVKIDEVYNVGVLVWMEDMILGHLGKKAWTDILNNVQTMCERLLIVNTN